MKIVKHVLLSITSLLFLLEPVLVSVIRNKRVLYGHTANEGHRDAYDSFRYYVFLSNEQPGWFLRKLGIRVTPDPENLVCGGTLLTPFIVQTAAHCVAIPTGAPENNVIYLQPMNVWENPLYSYVGANLVTKMVDWLKPKHYVTYATSRMLGGKAAGVLPIIYDYGLVLTTNRVYEKAPVAPISYAPVYRRASITSFYEAAIAKEYMCLHIGHGAWRIGHDDQVGLYIDPVPTENIRWGWRTIMNQPDCAYVTYTKQHRKEFYFNYTQDATWVCSQAFQHIPREREFLYHPGHGDSGGPYTCNSVYFAVVSGGSSGNAFDIITHDSPILNTLFENSAEERDNFIGYYSDVVWPNAGDLVPVHFSSSSSSPKTLVHSILLLATSTFPTLLFDAPE